MAAVAAVLAMTFVAVRLFAVADGDVSRFVVAGSEFADPAGVPDSLHVFPGDGYDGQFYWRLAADPFDLHIHRHLGVRLDTPLRSQRIGYPVLAWALSGGGNRAVLPWSLLAVNLLALAGLAFLGAELATAGRRSGWWGLAVASVPAFAFTLSRDLTELVAGVALLAGIVAIRRQRYGMAAGAWAFAVLSREQLALVVFVYGVWRLAGILRRKTSWGWADLPWAAAGATFVAWQVALIAVLGQSPLRSSGSQTLTVPLAGLGPAAWRWLSHPSGSHAVFLAEGLVLVLLVGAALASRGTAEWERWAVAVGAILVVSLSADVWRGPADFRTVSDVSLLGWTGVLSTDDLPGARLLVLLQAATFTAAAGLRLQAI